MGDCVGVAKTTCDFQPCSYCIAGRLRVTQQLLMPPRRRTKKSEQDQDKLFEKSQKKLQKTSKWLQALQQADEPSQPIVQKPKPTFDFSQQQQFLKLQEERIRKKQELERLIYEAEEEMPDEEELSDRETDEEKAERIKKLERIKERKKMKKQRERELRRMEVEEFERQQQILKEEQQKNEILQKVEPKGPNYLPYIIILFGIGLFYMFYKGQMYQRLQRFRVTADLYEVLEADSSLSNTQLKSKYKKLVLKYHPDKNRNCVGCKEKFTKIVQAWQVLGNAEKREAYDSSHSIMKIKSNSVSLNEQNYQRLVEDSDDLWIIQVYDETNEYCHRYSPIWEEIINQFKGFVKFGRIDAWHQQEMLSYVPYKFTIYPSIYSLYKGHSDLYSFDFGNPLGSLKKFIGEQIKPQIQQITDPHFNINDLNTGNKVSLIIPTQRLHLPYQLRSIALRYKDYMRVLTVNPTSNGDFLAKHSIRSPRLFFNSSFSQPIQLQTDSQGYMQLDRRISRSIIRSMPTDKMMQECSEQTCLLVLNPTIESQISNKHYPRIRVTDTKFYTHLEKMKAETHQLENFDLGIYMDDKIALGYVEDVDGLTLDQGELLGLEYQRHVPVKWWNLGVGLGLVLWGVRKQNWSVKEGVKILIGVYYLVGEAPALLEKVTNELL